MKPKVSRYLVAIKLEGSYYLWAKMTPKYAFNGGKENITVCVFRDSNKLVKEIAKLTSIQTEAPRECILLEVKGVDEKEVEKNLIAAISDLTGAFSIDTVDIGLFGNKYYQAGWYIRNKENIDKYRSLNKLEIKK